jgi:hypothetical protein
MFYDVLMEKRAEREEEKKQPSFLRRNAGNLAAIPVAAGGLAGAQYFIEQPERATEKAFDELHLRDRATHAEIQRRMDALDEIRKKGPGIDELMQQNKYDEVRAAQKRHADSLQQGMDEIREMREGARKAWNSGRASIHEQAKKLQSNARPKALAAGGLGLLGAYGAKKLVDRYALRNQQRD